jgi:hypothetical protein
MPAQYDVSQGKTGNGTQKGNVTVAKNSFVWHIATMRGKREQKRK